MRIFERLRARGGKDASVERRLIEAIIADLSSKLDEPATPPSASESKVAPLVRRPTDDQRH